MYAGCYLRDKIPYKVLIRLWFVKAHQNDDFIECNTMVMWEGWKNTRLCIAISAPWTAALSHLPLLWLLILPVQSNHTSFDEYTSASTNLWCGSFTHTMSTDTRQRKKKNTWGQIHISSWWKIITALTVLSSPYIRLSSLQSPIWIDVWIRWDDMHIFSDEASLCLLSHGVVLGEMMTRAPRSIESPNKHLAASPPRKIHNINHLISRSPGIVSWVLSDKWIISSHLSLKTYSVQRQDARGHQIWSGMWREGKT